MKLTQEGINNQTPWLGKGYNLPQYDRSEIRKNTKEAPFWIHFGGGNIFRAFQANVVQDLLNRGTLNRGLIVAEGFDYEIIEKSYRPHDDLSLLATFKADGSIEKTVVGSVMESLILDSENPTEYDRLKEIFASDSLQMATFTITEKGYSLVNAKGEMIPAVEEDMKKGPAHPGSYMGKVSSLLYHRFVNGKKPIAMVSMDNCSHNGDKLFAAVTAFAKGWEEAGVCEKGFLSYVESDKVSFPWTMIDKITPRPNEAVERILNDDGVEDLAPVITSMKSYVAPFVNAEESQYLVIEDDFPNGREKLEEAGLYFTDRATVDKVEKMKVCTCLNPLHTALAVFGCLLGYDLIADEMKNETLRGMVERIGRVEGMPVVVNPGIMNPEDFLNTVLNVRIPNPYMPDTPQRIATDTSQKLAIRFGETIKAYEKNGLSMEDLKLIPVVFAGWFRYLMAIDDKGNAFELSPDPLYGELKPYIDRLSLGKHDKTRVEEAVGSILKNKQIFGVDLYEAGLADKVISTLCEFLEGPGAVEKVLKTKVAEAKQLGGANGVYQ